MYKYLYYIDTGIFTYYVSAPGFGRLAASCSLWRPLAPSCGHLRRFAASCAVLLDSRLLAPFLIRLPVLFLAHSPVPGSAARLHTKTITTNTNHGPNHPSTHPSANPHIYSPIHTCIRAHLHTQPRTDTHPYTHAQTNAHAHARSIASPQPRDRATCTSSTHHDKPGK